MLLFEHPENDARTGAVREHRFAQIGAVEHADGAFAGHEKPLLMMFPQALRAAD